MTERSTNTWLRTITVPADVVKAAAGAPQGTHVECCVEVDWPELRLTEEQIMANAIAHAYGQEEPYPNRSLFTVRLPYVQP